MDDEEVAGIREAVAVGDFVFDQQHLDAHAFAEGFSLRDAIAVVVTGEVIEDALPRNRRLFCATIEKLKQNARFRGQWLHTVVQRDANAEIALITAYRPLVREWRTERERR